MGSPRMDHQHEECCAAAPAMPRSVVVSEVRLYREGLAWSLRQRLDVVATPGSADAALDIIASLRPEFALVDAALPDGVALVRALGLADQPTRAIAVAIAEVESTVLEWAEAGVVGYTSRDASINDLLDIIDSAARGDFPCTPRIAGSLLRRVATLAGGNRGAAPAAALTAREKEIVTLISRGCSNKQIAVALGIEVATVKNHVHNILEKLHISGRGEIAHWLRTSCRLDLVPT